jgi:hypothetical protein
MKKTFWVPITLALAAYFLLPLPGLSAPPVSQRIEKKRAEIEQVKRREDVLTTTIQRFSTRIAACKARSARPGNGSGALKTAWIASRRSCSRCATA